MIMAYQPCAPGRHTTRGEMVWDQHHWYFEACREIRHPQAMFKSDLLSLLRRWKAAGDEILLMGDFNKNIYIGTKMRKFPLPVMDMPVHVLGSVRVLAFFWDPLPELN
jgi:hypothetical protein